MTQTTVFKISAADASGGTHTVTISDPNATINAETLSDAVEPFANVGLNIVYGQYVTTTAGDKISLDD